jgi:hypothetical protein
MLSRCLLVVAALFVLLPAAAGAQTPADVFDPGDVKALHLELENEGDWDTIRRDTTNSIEVPAWFHAEGDAAPILVSVRRKSSRALPDEIDPQKVGLKVDINEYVSGQEWRGLRKLSLENGTDTDPISEGLAWNLHERASGPGFYHPNYHPGRAAWATLTVDGANLGVYINVEQRDSQLLRNRVLIDTVSTRMSTSYRWLYEIDDVNGFEFEVGGPAHSATFTELCYPPFGPAPSKKGQSGGCATPSDTHLESRLPQVIDMPAMLTQGAVDAFSSNNDALFSHGKNYFFADSDQPLQYKRVYFPWDLDAAIRDPSANIYATAKGKRLEQTAFQSVILNHPAFRAQYNQIMLALTAAPNGPLSAPALNAFLDGVTTQDLRTALAEDPYMPMDADEHIAWTKNWAAKRIDSVRSQASATNPKPPARTP